MNGNQPEGWAESTVADTCERVVVGFVGPSKQHYVKNGVPFLTGKNVKFGRLLPDPCEHVSRAFHARQRKSQLRPNDVVVVRIGRSGEAAVVPAALSQANCGGLVIAKNPTAVQPEFLAWYLNSPEGQQQLLREVRGVTRQTLNTRSIAAALVPLPPLAEQRRIVEKVEAVLEQANRAKDRLAGPVLMLKRFRQTVLAMACSGGLTEDWRHSNAPRTGIQKDTAGEAHPDTDEDLNELPARWIWVSVDDACDAVIDYRGRTPPVTESGQIPHIRTSNLRDGRINWNSDSFVTEEVYGRYMTRGLPRRGDVIFTMEAPLGETAVVDTDLRFSLAQRLLLLRGKSTLVCGAYLALALRSSPVRHQIEQRATGSTVRGIAYKRLRDVLLPIPPIPEQLEIVRRVNAAIALAAEVERRVFSAIARLTKLMPAILAKAFSGELVPTEAELARAEGRTYETAEELLARVRRAAEGRTPRQPATGSPRRTRRRKLLA